MCKASSIPSHSKRAGHRSYLTAEFLRRSLWGAASIVCWRIVLRWSGDGFAACMHIRESATTDMLSRSDVQLQAQISKVPMFASLVSDSDDKQPIGLWLGFRMRQLGIRLASEKRWVALGVFPGQSQTSILAAPQAELKELMESDPKRISKGQPCTT
jgi:hypothetical protein